MIIIVGAGIAGLSLGCALVERGAAVTIVEAACVASGASGIATSYLEPRLGDTPMRKLERQSAREWRDWAAKLVRESGVDVHFVTDGSMRVASADTRQPFDRDMRLRQEQGVEFVLLNRDQILAEQPALSSKLEVGLLQPEVCWVDGAQTCEALAKIFQQKGGTLLTQWYAKSIETLENTITVRADGGRSLVAKTIVLANGMGANSMDGLPSDAPKCRPVRGVNLVVDQSSLSHPITRLIKHHRGNFCPRTGDKLIIGTTYEADEASLRVGADVIEKLYANAEDMLPQVRTLPLLEVTSGIRCKVGDGQLRIGRSLDNPRVAWSLSHAGAGYLRAPLVSREFAQYLMTGERSDIIDPFLNG